MKIIFLLGLILVVNSQAKQGSINKGSDVYEIKSFNVSSGGGVIESGNYKIISSIGQLDASNEMVSGVYTLQGGFIHQVRGTDVIFKNSFE
jgi:hypothetical protein